MNINHEIKAGRKRLGLSLEAFGKAVGVNRMTVSRWEIDGNPGPGGRHLPAVSKLLGIGTRWLEDTEAHPVPRGLALVGRLSMALNKGALSETQIRLLDDLLSEFIR